MRDNVLKVSLSRFRSNGTEHLYQYDYGQKIQFTDVELPETYEVHFSNDPADQSITILGDSTGVAIPDEFLQTGDSIYVWLYLHAHENDGETVFKTVIPVEKRSEPSNVEPTEVEQDLIAQTLAVLNTAISETRESVAYVNEVADGVGATVNTALQEALDSGAFDSEG